MSLYIEQYIKSESYNIADYRFDSFIKPIISSLDLEKSKYLLKSIEDNSQIYGRMDYDTNKIMKDHLLLKEKIDLLQKDFDYSEYINFNKSIK